jgi:hypothetical protein
MYVHTMNVSVINARAGKTIGWVNDVSRDDGTESVADQAVFGREAKFFSLRFGCVDGFEPGYPCIS